MQVPISTQKVSEKGMLSNSRGFGLKMVIDLKAMKDSLLAKQIGVNKEVHDENKHC